MTNPFKSVPIASSEITPKQTYLSRRDFIKAAGVVAGGVVLAACAPAANGSAPQAGGYQWVNGKLVREDTAVHPSRWDQSAFAVEPFAQFLARFRRHLAKVERVMGGLLVLTGIAFLTGFVSQASFWLLEMFPALGTIG